MINRPSSVAITRPAVSASESKTILDAANRLGFAIYNSSGQSLYVNLLGGAASATAKSFTMLDGAYYESQFGISYGTAITALMAGGTTGYVDVTEFK